MNVEGIPPNAIQQYVHLCPRPLNASRYDGNINANAFICPSTCARTRASSPTQIWLFPIHPNSLDRNFVAVQNFPTPLAKSLPKEIS